MWRRVKEFFAAVMYWLALTSVILSVAALYMGMWWLDRMRF